MPFPRSIFAFATVVLLGSASIAIGAEKGKVILLRHRSGGQEIDFTYTFGETRARIDQIRPEDPMAASNLIDLKSGGLTLLTPHNRARSTYPSRAFIPEIQAPPPLPVQSPPLPLPPPGAGQPAPPPPPDPSPAAVELEPTEDSMQILGHSCIRHTLRTGTGTVLDLWLTDDAGFPPFYLITSQPPSPSRHRIPHEVWPHLVRVANKFPMRIVHRREDPAPAELPDGHPDKTTARKQPAKEDPIATWDVISITSAQIDPTRLEIPEDYLEVTDEPAAPVPR